MQLAGEGNIKPSLLCEATPTARACRGSTAQMMDAANMAGEVGGAALEVINPADPTKGVGIALKGLKTGAKALGASKGIRKATEKSDELADYSHNYNRAVGASQRVPNVLQTGGNTLNKRTATVLNEQLGENLNRREWGRALEELKSELGLPANHHARILDNGDYIDDAGNILGNLQDYIP